MYNDFYRTPSPLPHPVKPPPPDLPPQHQPPMSQSFATPSYIQRSGDPPSRTGNSPPLMPRVPSSMMTDRLNWRHEEGSQAVRGAVNPSEFYPRVPGALVDRQSYTQSQPAAAAAINIGQPVSDLGFYSFAIQSTPAATFSRSQPAIQPHAAPIQYSANGFYPVPPLPPKPFSNPPQASSLAPPPIPAPPLPPPPPPPIPPKVFQSPPNSLHEISRPQTPHSRPPEYTSGSGDTTRPFLPEKGRLHSDDEQHDDELRKAIVASQEAHRVAELRNQQLLLQHMSTLKGTDPSEGDEFVVRESVDEDFECLSPLGPASAQTVGISRTDDDATSSEGELIRRATQLSLIEAEIATARAQQSIHATDDYGWEVYDPRAFGEESHHAILFASPVESFPASPHLSPAAPSPQTIQRPPAVLPSPPQSPPLRSVTPAPPSGPVQQAESTRAAAPTPDPILRLGPDAESLLTPPPSYAGAISSRSAPSSPPSQPRPEIVSFNSAPAVSPTQDNGSPSFSPHDRPTPDYPHPNTGPIFSRSRTYQAPHTPTTAQPWNAGVTNEPPPALVGRDRTLRTSASQGNLRISARTQGQDFIAPPIPPLSASRAPSASFSTVEDTKAPPQHPDAPLHSEKPFARELSKNISPILVSSEAGPIPSKLALEEPRTPGRGRSKSQTPPAYRSEWPGDVKSKSPSSSRTDDMGSPTESSRRPQPSSLVSYLGDLMTGVSFGLGRAILLAKNQLPDRPFPDVISLGPNDAFFIAAPTFRQLLRLLANLGHGVIEELRPPQAGSQAHLRPALQLVQVRPPEEPYIILWLELEVQLPEGVHCNGDTSVRAYRSVLPPNVQHAPNRGSHLFVCQAPLPPLPRELPDVSTYLQSLVVKSRQMADTTGLRRLSKLIDKFYPNDVNGVVEAPARRGIFSRVIPGRKGARRSTRAGGDLNDESYDLVTPFRLDA